MSKAAISYYDWELNFKRKSENKQELNKDLPNSIGISDIDFREFIQKWKKKNLS